MKVYLFTLLILINSFFTAHTPALADGIKMQRVHIDLPPHGSNFNFTLIPQHIDFDITTVQVPEGCRFREENNTLNMFGIASKFNVICQGPLVGGATLTLPFISETVYITYGGLGENTPKSEMLSNKMGETFEVNLGIKLPKAIMETVGDFLSLGIIHILKGWDHLSFVLCLCFIALGRQLFFLATAFTLGHSISMALAFLGIISFPVPPIEAVIALSILFVAREAWVTQFRPPSRLYKKKPPQLGNLVIVSLFGLIHGLGFASILLDLGISKSEQITGLIFFNLGVEIGQLIFIAGVLVISSQLKAMSQWPTLLRILLLAVGSLGTFWTLVRVASF